MLVNGIRMALCVVIGLAMTVFQSGVSSLKVDIATLGISALSGITSSIFVVSWIISIKKGAYMMMDVFLMLGMIIPLTGSSIIFSESISPMQWLGLTLLMTAVIIMCSYNNTIKGKMGISSFVLLIICGLANGFTDFSQKLFMEYSENVTIATFNFYTYVFSTIILLIFFVFFSVKDGEDKKTVNIKSFIGYIIVMSVCLFLNSYFQTKAAGYLPSAQLYPLSKGGSLILSSLMSAILFKERLTVKAVIGILMSFVALLIINL